MKFVKVQLLIICSFLALTTSNVFAQEVKETVNHNQYVESYKDNYTKKEHHVEGLEHDGEHEKMKRHKVSFYLGYAFIPQEISSHEGLLVPSFGLDYTFRISKKFSIGLVNDMEIAQYMIEVPGEGHGENGGTEELEREYAYVGALMLFYSPIKGWNVGVGPGIELEKNQNFAVCKFMIEKEFELPGEWCISPNFSYDIKGNVYDTWSFGVAFGKSF
ncbi:hypothetical protein EI427_12650 [Flammeovirga pectinis]|uniref:Outer membrane protein beta-barrel domain-containing protein n=1 Tax=Flammeovirga pectinis TaxID=2494373 RepID=A0A3Q9FRH0_9BACT|nr:hypothetical protein [Flammeovirga pectinis]AZQ63054.1 hypothetical protein EI427_12650 [Flammeovirga pectinis]